MQTRKWVTVLLLVLSVCIPARAANNVAMKLFAEGFDLIGAGKLQEATTKFEIGLKSDPNNAMAHYYLAESYLGLKKTDKAKIHYQKAAKLDPNGQSGKDAKERLAQLSDIGKSFQPGSEFKDCPGCPVMVVVPPGQFVMGSPPGELERDADESPPHIVRVGHFAVGKFEITFDEWDVCVAERACEFVNDSSAKNSW